ncbi:hypothetical protein BKA58DRAFT_456931 [Alternaria rosae]|uniref:uncharacterized protein n=1 Tax=Alternaria rosae TaxID=1187941 RepID=UPI001E8CB6AD|nr:uncharacterized protein BKA58DRAFT_456931 [Alternaria rosae]KAH6873310.1 hypothetical protein BKA58DRAFT_456931 [Alternaria rosae]
MRFQLPSLTPFVMAAMMATPSLAASPGLYLCQNWGFNDRPDNFCYKYTEPWGKCTTITGRFSGGDRGVSSAGPDQGNWCTLYENEGCTGAELQLYWPGFSALSQVGWNDRAKSFNCAAL